MRDFASSLSPRMDLPGSVNARVPHVNDGPALRYTETQWQSPPNANA